MHHPELGMILLTIWLGAIPAFATAEEPNDPHGPIRGLEAVAEPLPWFDDEPNYPAYYDVVEPTYEAAPRGKKPDAVPAVTSRGRPRMSEPIRIMLSRHRYPAADRHLDVIVRFDKDYDQQPTGRLLVTLEDERGQPLSESAIGPIPGAQLHFAYRFPTEMAGETGRLSVQWERGGEIAGEDESEFRVDAQTSTDDAGRVPIRVPNRTEATVEAAPVTVGVPFPRGAVANTDHLRLVDEQDNEIPLQVKRTASWSRFGSVKWVMCDFTVDLHGEPRKLWLEYGPDIRRTVGDAIDVEWAANGFPHVDAGRVRIDDEGLAYDVADDGVFHVLLQPEALLGAFVEHARGANYMEWGHRWMQSTGQQFTMPANVEFEFEERGPVKVVIRARGWYEDEGSSERFCKFDNRYVIHRDSPIVRIFHTWMFTGDSNRDRIRNMGWRFPLGDLEPTGFLSALGDDGDWLEGYYLRQHDHDEYVVFDYDEPQGHSRIPEAMDAIPARPIDERTTGRRAPGVMAAAGEGRSLYVGVQDFWKNFPSSLMLEDDAMTFYQWPRYGRERTEGVRLSEDDDIWNVRGNVWRLWFAHEGETLSFALPIELTEGRIYTAESGPEPHFAHGDPESVNAQGIAKTAEMWLYLSDDQRDAMQANRVLEGLADETLRGVVDPTWMADSGAFYEIAAVDDERFPGYARTYRNIARAPLHQVERMGIYGKWIYGDLLRPADMDDQSASLYRTFRKAHWGWPYSWLPYVATGEPEFLRFAQAATRMMTDIAFVEYVSDDVRDQFERLPKRHMWASKQPFREIGWHNRNLIPWAGYWGPTTRLYVDEAEYLWHAWYVSGYHRARDIALKWAEHTKNEAPFTVEEEKMGRGPITAARNRGRWAMNLQKQYLEMYEATFDPWFLAAAHAIAEMHLHRFHEEGYRGHTWNTGPVDFQRYTADPDHEAFFLAFARHWHDGTGWAGTRSNLYPAVTFAYRLSEDITFLRQATSLVDHARWSIHDGREPWYYQGWYKRSGEMEHHMLFVSWAQKWFPYLLRMIHEYDPPVTPLGFSQTLDDNMHIVVRKAKGDSLELNLTGSYRITDAEGSTIDEGDADGSVVLDAHLPAGTYRIMLDDDTVEMPVSSPGTPEVLVLGEDQTLDTGDRFAQYHFYVPEELDSFWVEFEDNGFDGRPVRQVMIWDPDGREVWAHRDAAANHDEDGGVIRADIDVPSEHAGDVWRLLVPGVNMPVRFDVALPAAVAHDASRWFDPEGQHTD